MILQVRRLVSAGSDGHGNAGETFAEPVSWDVWGLAPGSMREAIVGRDLSEVAWSVMAPKSSAVPTERDVVIFDGDDYAVNGRPQDYTNGPWPHPTAGVVVELLRVEG